MAFRLTGTIIEPAIRRVRTSDLTEADVAALRGLLWAAFPPGEEGFTEHDWDHATGGIHVVLEVDDHIVAHAAVVTREIHLADRPVRTGYVEAVATAPDRQHLGLGTLVMVEVGSIILSDYELGALGTGVHAFYERLGWIRWRGPSSVRTKAGTIRTPDDDGYIMVLPTPTSPALDPIAPISCAWRSGDVW